MTEIAAQLSEALADRYVIDRLIGEGGMATVYLARDVRHNRKVALKVLRPDLGAVVGIEGSSARSRSPPTCSTPISSPSSIAVRREDSSSL